MDSLFLLRSRDPANKCTICPICHFVPKKRQRAPCSGVPQHRLVAGTHEIQPQPVNLHRVYPEGWKQSQATGTGFGRDPGCGPLTCNSVAKYARSPLHVTALFIQVEAGILDLETQPVFSNANIPRGRSTIQSTRTGGGRDPGNRSTSCR